MPCVASPASVSLMVKVPVARRGLEPPVLYHHTLPFPLASLGRPRPCVEVRSLMTTFIADLSHRFVAAVLAKLGRAFPRFRVFAEFQGSVTVGRRPRRPRSS